MQQKFILGKAKTAIACGFETTTETQFISFTELKESQFRVGESLLNSEKDYKEGNTTILIIKNLEGLAVLEKMIKCVKSKLKEDLKLINNHSK